MNDISRVVHRFYELAREDILIGYHFRRIENFDTHIPRIIHFWEIQLLGVPQRLEPFDLIKAHMPLGIKVGEVNRWVKLFLETLAAEKIEASLELEWKKKVQIFQNRFLSHPQLFSRSP